MTNKRWEISPTFSNDIIEQLLAVRGILASDQEEFLNPPFPDLDTILSKISIDKNLLESAVSVIKSAIKKDLPIVVHGDYDVDGICATAILWETIYFSLGYKNVYPYIPDRFSEGYGLSIESIGKIKTDLFDNTRGQKLKMKNGLLITVDCGITSVREVEYAKKLGLEVIITDHHTPGRVLPKASAVVHTTDLTGGGVAWLLSQFLISQQCQEGGNFLDLVALSTIADMQPLLRANRSLVKHGLKKLRFTRREGLKALIQVSDVTDQDINSSIVSWRLSPRLNAMGRLENALDSLRLLCTKNPQKAIELAQKLNSVNYERQRMTETSVAQAMQMIDEGKSIQILYHDAWHEGVIGLVAGKIKEKIYRPTIAISKGEKYSKGSARSIENFNIIEALRECDEYLVSVGGHPMAAGFTLKTSEIDSFAQKLFEVARRRLKEEDLLPVIKIDAQIDPSTLNWELIELLKRFEPFGVGNRNPIFLSRGLKVVDAKLVGASGTHLRLLLSGKDRTFPAIGFGLGYYADTISLGDSIDLVYTLSENEYNGQKEIQIGIKDLDKSNGYC